MNVLFCVISRKAKHNSFVYSPTLRIIFDYVQQKSLADLDYFTNPLGIIIVVLVFFSHKTLSKALCLLFLGNLFVYRCHSLNIIKRLVDTYI